MFCWKSEGCAFPAYFREVAPFWKLLKELQAAAPKWWTKLKLKLNCVLTRLPCVKNGITIPRWVRNLNYGPNATIPPCGLFFCPFFSTRFLLFSFAGFDSRKSYYLFFLWAFYGYLFVVRGFPSFLYLRHGLNSLLYHFNAIPIRFFKILRFPVAFWNIRTPVRRNGIVLIRWNQFKTIRGAL